MQEIVASTIENSFNTNFPSGNYESHIITGELRLNNHRIDSLNFSNSIFKNKVIVALNDYHPINFFNVIFEDLVLIRNSNGRSFDFSFAKFKRGIEISDVSDISIDLNNAKIDGDVNISGNFKLLNLEKIKHSTNSHKSYFNVSKCDIKSANFSNTFLNNLKVNDSTFHRQTSFDNSQIIYDDVPYDGNFFNVNFKSDVYFNNVDFGKAAFFNGATFSGSALFIGCNPQSKDSIADFSGASFRKRAFFDQSYFDDITFKNVEFSEVASFKDFTANMLEFSKCYFPQGADFINAKINEGDRETFRVIKNEFSKLNNQVEALKYYSKEMIAYERENSFKESAWEFFLLRLNRASNKHGQSWSRGVLFTISVAIVFFIFYLCSLSKLPFNWGWVNFESFVDASNKTIMYYLKFFLPAHDIDFMNEYKPNAISYLIDTLGRIFVGYGIYQTIQAFRKYGKS